MSCREQDGMRGSPICLDRWLMNPDVLTSVALRLRKRRGAWAPGGDGVVGYELSASDCRVLALKLSAEIKGGTYTPGPMRALFRRQGTKVRKLMLSPFRDRILQTALLYGMGPYVETQLAPGSYAVRGSGVGQAVSDVVAELALHAEHYNGEVHLVKADFDAFFDSIPHAPLQELIRGTFGGRRVRRFMAATLDAGGSRFGAGLAQGSALSPMLANWYLCPVDWYFNRRRTTLFYSRYMDDVMMVVPGDHDRALSNLHELERQAHRLGLKLNRNKSLVVSATEGADFLGFRLRLGVHGAEIVPNQRSVAKLRKRLDEVPDDGSTSVNLHAARAAWAAYFNDLAPEASAIGDRLVAEQLAARLLRQPVAETPVKGTGGTR